MLIVALLFMTVMLAAVVSVMSVVSVNVQDMRINSHELRARMAAEAGVAEGIALIKEARDLAALAAPFDGIDQLDSNAATGTSGYTSILTDQPLRDFSGAVVGEYDVLVDVLNSADSSRTVAVAAYAYVPNKAAYESRVRDALRKDAHCTVTVSLGNARVFEYAYFINHWGWLYGDSITVNGNARSNGQFDFGNTRATVNGSPRYEDISGTDLSGYIDDNNDGVFDGSDGGVYAGYSVIAAANVRGMGGLAKNQHGQQDRIEMPNLADLALYEDLARDLGSAVRVGPVAYVESVLGDDTGEREHLFLSGTQANPIELNGPVVVRGSVIIKGYVTGQGAIYAGGNIYVADDVVYVDGPATPRPTANDEATVEAWLSANATKDALALFSAEHIVIGDYTQSSWQSNVGGWLAHPLNKSREDAGSDGIQNTRAGPDGVTGTVDDDVLEDDGMWTVERYDTTDQARGLIPAGRSVGDVVPETGEDIDGDGQYDDQTAMTEFNVPAALSSANWAGNVDWSGARNYSEVATVNIARVDGALYTNHTLGARMVNSGGAVTFNGAVVSRNEAIVASASSIVMNHDERLTGGRGEQFGFYLPRVWSPLSVQWDFEKDLAVSGDQIVSAGDLIAYLTGGEAPSGDGGQGNGNNNGNQGHGNNADGVDSSNPGNAPFEDSDPSVDDEAGGGGSTSSKGKGKGKGKGN